MQPDAGSAELAMARKEGLIGRKIGMTQVFSDDGSHVPVTVIEAGPCTIIGIRTQESHGYDALQIGFGAKKKNVSKPAAGLFKKANVAPMRVVREVRLEKTDKLQGYQVGQALTVEMFTAGELVDVVGVTKGKGFQGGVKRYGWYGGDATHGSMFHRAPGSIGASSDPSRVWPGHHMPGRRGGDRRAGTNDTKGRSEGSGGGRKPWKQKGTGRARQGSTRAVQWKGGGKPFGPTPRSYDKDLPRSMRRGALRAAVAAKVAAGQLSAVETIDVPDGKTKSLVTRLGALGLAGEPTLLVVRELAETVARAARNVPWLTVETPAHVSVYQLLQARRVLFERAGLLALEEALAK